MKLGGFTPHSNHKDLKINKIQDKHFNPFLHDHHNFFLLFKLMNNSTKSNGLGHRHNEKNDQVYNHHVDLPVAGFLENAFRGAAFLEKTFLL